jgi:hemerythrin-like domain-containing protein
MPTPAENLTARHGAVTRLLLVYEDASKQMQNGQQVNAKPLYDATKIIHSTVIELHAPLEEQYIYPRVEQSGRYANTVKTLRQQHAAAREINTMLMDMTKTGSISDAAQAAQAMNEFRRMLTAHIAWEHSEIFSAFRDMTAPDQYTELGRQFLQKERAMLGGEGFAQVLSQVASIEADFGFRDLSQFTAKVRRAPVAAAERTQ